MGATCQLSLPKPISPALCLHYMIENRPMSKKMTFVQFFRDFLHTDRFDVAIRTTIPLLLCLTIPLAMILIIVSVFMIDSNDQSLSSRDWFSRVVRVNPDLFHDIQHHFIDGMDYSHQFRFSYDRVDDIEAIIDVHRMDRCFLRSGIWSSSRPEWYDLRERNGVVHSYCSEDATESNSLFVDESRQVAYFEFSHL